MTPGPIGLAVLILAGITTALILGYSFRLGIPPTPTSRYARRKILELLPDQIEGTILELGAGWGGLAVVLARAYPAARIVAYEASPIPWIVARLRACLGRHGNLEVRRRNFLRESLSGGDAVVCYLFRGIMEPLGAKLAKELRPGTPVVTHAFRIPNWEPEREETVPEIWRGVTYLYRVK